MLALLTAALLLKAPYCEATVRVTRSFGFTDQVQITRRTALQAGSCARTRSAS